MKVFKYFFLALFFIGCQSNYEKALKSFKQHKFRDAQKTLSKIAKEDTLYSKAQDLIAVCKDSILADSARILFDKTWAETEKKNLDGALKFLQALPEADFLKYNPKKEYLILQCKGAIEYRRKNYKLSLGYLTQIPKEDNDDDYYAQVKELVDSAKTKLQLWRKDSSIVMQILNKEFEYSRMRKELNNKPIRPSNISNTQLKNLTRIFLAERVYDEFVNINIKIESLKIPTEISNDSIKTLLKQSKEYLKESVNANTQALSFYLEYLKTENMAEMDEFATEMQASDSLNALFINCYKKVKDFYTRQSEENNEPKAIPREEMKPLKNKYGF